MKAIKLYKQLEKDLITSRMSDAWMQYMVQLLIFFVITSGKGQWAF